MLSVLFVNDNATPGGDGLSWGSAFDDLQGALERASTLRADGDPGNDVDQIWIAQGIYKPTAELEPGDPRSASFSLVDGVTLYGGFSATETTLTERNWSAHETVLSGDLGVVGDDADNAFTVVSCGAGIGAFLDGLRIAGGNANGTDISGHLERRAGGGLWNYGNLTVANGIISGNSAITYGGGVFNAGTLTITGGAFVGNSADGGGGVFNAGMFELTNGTISENSAENSGGGVFNYGTLTSTNGVFLRNSAEEQGGGINNSGTATVTNNTFAWNTATDGGGIYNFNGTLTLNNSIVAENAASTGPDVFQPGYVGTVAGSYNLIGDGTGQRAFVNRSNGNLVGSSNAPIDALLLTNGHIQPGSPAIDRGDNALIPSGITTDPAGVPRIQDGDGDQTAIVDMGAFEATPPFLSISDSSIIEGDSGTTDMVFTVTLTDVTDHDIAFDYVTTDGTAEAGTDYTATSGTSTIPAGETTTTIAVPIHGDTESELDETFSVTLTSLSGVLRPCGAGSILNDDMAVVTTSADAVDPADGLLSLREALNQGYSIITFDPALWAEAPATITLAGTQLSVDSDVSIKGPGAELMQIDAGGNSRVLWIEDDVTASISGLTITGGSADDGGAIYNRGTLTLLNSTISENAANRSGGGLFNDTGVLTIADTTFSKNSTNGNDGDGGGIYNGRGMLTVTGSTISENSTNDDGGGIYNHRGTVTVTNCTVSGNSTNDDGGGIYGYSGTVTVTGCTVSGNSASDYGGGIHAYSGTLTLTNSMLLANSAYGGGGIYNEGTMTVTNDTISGNDAYYGGGVYNRGALTLNNSIIAKNEESYRTDIYLHGGTLSGAHNLIGDGTGQAVLVNGVDGNLVGSSAAPMDPAFLTDFRLQSSSPAVDAGDNAILPSDIPTDLSGAPRIQDGDGDQTPTVDMGAYEAVPGPYVSITDSSLVEGDVGIRNMVFTVTLTDVADRPITFDYATQDGTAEAGADYTAAGGTLTIPVGETSVTIVIPIHGDVEGELDETFSVILSTQVATVRTFGVGTILDNNDPATVTTLSDVVDATDGVLSLREALNNGFSIITFDRTLCVGGPKTVALAGSQLTVASDVTIEGPGAEMLSISGCYHSRVLFVSEGVTASISGLTVTHGSTTTDGGGIYNNGTLTVTESVLSRNAADGSDGKGGGIYNNGTLTVTNSTFLKNTAGDSQYGYAQGGGINNRGTLTIANSMLLENSACREGGGIYNEGTLTATNNTITENDARYGGGIANRGGTLTLNNSIVAKNAASSYSNVYNWAATLAGSHNLIGSGSGQASLVHGTDGNLVGGSPHGIIDPLLFADFRPRPDSPAVDAGNNALVPAEVATDVTGRPRIQDGDGDHALIVDMGAYEAFPDPYLSISDSSIIEGDSGTANMVFNVTLTHAADHAITFSYATGDGTAEAGTDYAATAGSATIPAGETATAVTVPVHGDGYGELDETFFVTLTNSSFILRPSAKGLILDDNDPVAVTTLDDVVNPTDGLLSLREALSDGYSNITFDPALYANGPATIALTGSQLVIDSEVSIKGPGAELLSIDGGGTRRVFLIEYGATVSLSGLTINGGYADYGGGIRNRGTLTLVDGVLLENTASKDGGGIYNQGMLTVTSSTFSRNSAEDAGGGIYGTYQGASTIENSTFQGNAANDGCGGGIENNKGAFVVTNSTFSGNSASEHGGGISDTQGTLTVTGAAFSGNSAGRYGGGICSSGTLAVTNGTLSGNVANEGYGGIFSKDTITLSNSILWRNSGGDLEDRGAMSLLRNLIGIDPQFAREPSDGGDGWGDNPDTPEVNESINDDFGNLRLSAQSPAIDYGHNSLAVDAEGNPLATDSDGNPRFYGAAVDVGAYEFQDAAAVDREDASLTVTTSEDVFDLYDDQVSLREAIYYAGTDSLGGTITFDGVLDGATITLSGTALRIDKELTIDASSLTSLTVDADEASHAFAVTARAPAVVELKGLTITGGAGNYGGGIFSSSALTVDHCTIQDNSASRGGGIYSSGSLTVRGSMISENRGGSGGGGIFGSGGLTVDDSIVSRNGADGGGGICASGDFIMTGSLVSENEANEYGGGLIVYGTSFISNSVISENEAGEYGGGIRVCGTTTLSESTISKNRAGERGGGLYIDDPTTVINCTLWGNSSSRGGGVYVVDQLAMTNSTVVRNLAFGGSGMGGGMFIGGTEASTTLNNTVVAENFVSSSGFDVYLYSGTLAGSNNLIGEGERQSSLVDGIDGNQVGTHQSPVDPRLGDPITLQNGTLAFPLLAGSPALDAGNNALAVDATGQPLQNDADGNSRIQGSAVDLGALEGITSTVPGQVYEVTSLENVIDPADGKLTFIEAFTAAEENRPVGEAPSGSFSDQDLICLAGDLTGTLLLDGRSISVAGHLQIKAPGAERVTFDANRASRVFDVLPGASLAVSGLTITGGKAYRGGGIIAFGNLHVTDCAIVDNQTTGGPNSSGGGTGVIVIGGKKTENPVSDKTSKVENTFPSYLYGGAGIFGAGGDVTVVRSTISGNEGVGTYAGGGGIYHNQGSLVVENSVISDNSSGSALYCYHGTATVTNSMFVRNDGGVSFSRSPATLTNSLVFRNRGYGLYVSMDVVHMNNTIIAENCGDEGSPDIHAYDLTLEGSNNIIGDGTSQTDLVDGVDGNHVGTSESPIDPLLSDRTQMDDGTWEYYLLPGSPALDAGNNALAVDAQGQPLRKDLHRACRIQGGTVDIGPFEGAHEGTPASVYVVTSLANTVDAGDGELTLIEAFEAANRNRPVGDAPAGSYRYQDVIRFADDLTGTITLDGEPLIALGDVRIEGPGGESLTIDAAGQSRVFEVRPYVQLDLSGMMITGGENRLGGAIFNEWGELSLEQALVTGNSAWFAGGGIYNDHGHVVLTETAVSENVITQSSWSDGRSPAGGGVYSDRGILQIDECVFSNNTARDGGGLWNSGTATVVGSVFTINQTLTRGGAMSNAGILAVRNTRVEDNSAGNGAGIYTTGVLTVEDSTLSGNLAGQGGGAVLGDENSDVTIIASSITANIAKYGGGLHVSGDLAVVDSTVSENASEGGGAVYITDTGVATIDGSTISRNEVGDVSNLIGGTEGISYAHGGAIRNSGSLTITDSELSHNTVVGWSARGAAVHSLTGQVCIAGCSIAYNEGIGMGEARGGALYAANGSITVVASSLFGNRVTCTSQTETKSATSKLVWHPDYGEIGQHASGGGIHVWHADLTVLNSIISDNSVVNRVPAAEDVSAYGGGIASRAWDSTILVRLVNSTIAFNRLTGYQSSGGGLNTNSDLAVVTMDNSIVAMNHAESSGDDLAIGGSLSGSHNLIGNGSGQSWLRHGQSGNLVGTEESPLDPRFTDPTQFANGLWGRHLLPGSPAVDAGNSTLALGLDGQPLDIDVLGNPRIQDASVDIGAIEGPVAEVAPGQVYVVTSLANIIDATDQELTFVEALNAANENRPVGDAPAGSFCEADVIQFAEGIAGTLTLEGRELNITGDLKIQGPGAGQLTFDAENTSRVFNVRGGVDLELCGLTLTGGYAESGGAILNDGSLVLRDVIVFGNTVTGTGSNSGGGGIFNSGSLDVFDSHLIGNVAINSDGGAIFNSGSLLVLDSHLRDNMADGSGGAVLNDGIARFTRCHLLENEARSSGQSRGGGAIKNSCSLAMADSSVLGNSAAGSEGSGGGILNKSSLVVSNCEIVGNTAGANGGGICSTGGCEMNGGWITLFHATLDLRSSTLAGNVARKGGGMYCTGSSLIIISDGDQPESGEDPDILISNSIIAGNATSAATSGVDIVGSVTGTHNLVGDGSSQTALIQGENGNLVGTEDAPLDPLFTRPPSDGGDGWGDDPDTPDIDESANDDYGDLRLRSDSPAIDAGDNSLAFHPDGVPLELDLHGNPRILDGNGDGTATVDMGVFERPAGLEPLPGDLNGDGFVGSSDLDVIRANWGRDVTPGDLTSGDASGDGNVNTGDLNVIRANWGAVAAADAVFDSLGEDPVYDEPVHSEPVYGPALRKTATFGKDVRLTPRWLEALAAEAWKREREERMKDEG